MTPVATMLGFLFSGMSVSAFFHGRPVFGLLYLALSVSMFLLGSRKNRLR